MSISVRFEPKEGYLRAEVTGVFTLAEACRTFREALTVVHDRGATRILVDCLGLTGKPTTLDYYQYGEFIAAELMQYAAAGKGRLKLAYVARDPLVDPGHLSETVARNRAAQVAFVDTPAEALRWLGVASTRKAADRVRAPLAGAPPDSAGPARP